MKKIIRIEMADNDNIYDIATDGAVELHKLTDGEFHIVDNGEVVADGYYNETEADEALLSFAIDDDLIVTGWGKHSGRKFWQMPEGLKKEVVAFSRFCPSAIV